MSGRAVEDASRNYTLRTLGTASGREQREEKGSNSPPEVDMKRWSPV